MINAIIRWSLDRRVAVVVISGMLLIAGAYVASTMSVDIFPDLTAPTVTILTEGQGMAPEEMETLVTFPIEASVNGASGVRRVRSASAVGLSVVWVEFEWGTDIHKARQTVTERIATVKDSLPAGVEAPVLAPLSSIMGEIVFAALTTDRHDPIALRREAETVVRRRILSVAGVSQVTLIGGEEKQYQIVLRPERLRTYGIGVDEVVAAVARSNENVAAGLLIRGGQETIVQGIGRVRGTADLESVIVIRRGGVPVRVADLGVVQIGSEIQRGRGSASFRTASGDPITTPAVIIAIQKQPDANTLTLTRRLDQTFAEIQGNLPAGFVLRPNLFRQADFIETSIRHVVESLRDGGAIVILIVLLFLASLRAGVITLLAIPTSLVVAILALRLMGATINTMTLGGMAIAIGALVDDAIIDVENIVRRLRENAAAPPGQRRSAAAIVFHASVEVRASIVFATVIILLVFSPIFVLSGVEGRLLFPVGLSFTVALAASMVTALSLTPALASWLLPRSRTVLKPREPLVVRGLKAIYAPVLGFALRRPLAVTLPVVLLLGLAIFGLLRAGRSFLPEFNEGALVVGAVTLPGSSLDQSDTLARQVEETLMKHPEIVAIGRRTGRAEEDEHVQGVEGSEIDLTLDLDAGPRAGRPRRTKGELLEALRLDLGAIPGIQATFGQPISHRIDHMLSGTRSSIAIKIFGDDLVALRRIAEQAESIVRSIEGVVDLSSEQQASVPSTRIVFDRASLARHGVAVGDLTRTLESLFRGAPATGVIEGQLVSGVVVRLGTGIPGGDGDDVVGDVPVPVAGGYRVPLRALARVDEDVTANLVSRENLERKIVVMCNVAGRDVGGVVAEIRGHLSEGLALPRGYRIEYGGQFETAEATARRLTWLGLIVVLGIGFILHVVFRNVRDVILIMLNLPLALIGGVAGVFLGDGVVSVASLIGFITVFGIAARNGILMVSHIRHLELHEGVTDFREAVRRGAMERVSPIMMTAMAAGLALVPLALRGGQPGTELLAPMAFVILFGLLSSTFLNMIIVPSLLVRFGRSAAPREGGTAPAEVES